MIQICGDSIICPLKLIFEKAIRTSCFPDSWKKGNIIPVHKKESKNLVKNYRPISLLPIFGKIFEKVIYNSLFKYFLENIFCLISSLGSVQDIHALRNYLPSLMRYINHLMLILLLKPEVYFLIYQKLLIKFGMKDFSGPAKWFPRRGGQIISFLKKCRPPWLADEENFWVYFALDGFILNCFVWNRRLK